MSNKDKEKTTSQGQVEQAQQDATQYHASQVDTAVGVKPRNTVYDSIFEMTKNTTSIAQGVELQYKDELHAHLSDEEDDDNGRTSYGLYSGLVPTALHSYNRVLPLTSPKFVLTYVDTEVISLSISNNMFAWVVRTQMAEQEYHGFLTLANSFLTSPVPVIGFRMQQPNFIAALVYNKQYFPSEVTTKHTLCRNVYNMIVTILSNLQPGPLKDKYDKLSPAVKQHLVYYLGFVYAHYLSLEGGSVRPVVADYYAMRARSKFVKPTDIVTIVTSLALGSALEAGVDGMKYCMTTYGKEHLPTVADCFVNYLENSMRLQPQYISHVSAAMITSAIHMLIQANSLQTTGVYSQYNSPRVHAFYERMMNTYPYPLIILTLAHSKYPLPAPHISEQFGTVSQLLDCVESAMDAVEKSFGVNKEPFSGLTNYIGAKVYTNSTRSHVHTHLAMLPNSGVDQWVKIDDVDGSVVLKKPILPGTVVDALRSTSDGLYDMLSSGIHTHFESAVNTDEIKNTFTCATIGHKWDMLPILWATAARHGVQLCTQIESRAVVAEVDAPSLLTTNAVGLDQTQVDDLLLRLHALLADDATPLPEIFPPMVGGKLLWWMPNTPNLANGAPLHFMNNHKLTPSIFTALALTVAEMKATQSACVQQTLLQGVHLPLFRINKVGLRFGKSLSDILSTWSKIPTACTLLREPMKHGIDQLLAQFGLKFAETNSNEPILVYVNGLQTLAGYANLRNAVDQTIIIPHDYSMLQSVTYMHLLTSIAQGYSTIHNIIMTRMAQNILNWASHDPLLSRIRNALINNQGLQSMKITMTLSERETLFKELAIFGFMSMSMSRFSQEKHGMAIHLNKIVSDMLTATSYIHPLGTTEDAAYTLTASGFVPGYGDSSFITPTPLSKDANLDENTDTQIHEITL
jgi:hypothetical protein